MKSFLNVAVSLDAFGLTAIAQKWSIQKFCWCVWLAGLFLFMEMRDYSDLSNYGDVPGA